jgi:hypothetical protein
MGLSLFNFQKTLKRGLYSANDQEKLSVFSIQASGGNCKAIFWQLHCFNCRWRQHH